MILSALAFAATLLSSSTLVAALSANDIPADTPISSLLASANAHLAKGETNDALTYYDIAIARDPSNYLSHFRRGAAYLSLGRTAQATEDFEKVLAIKPGHEPALLQRAKIRARNGDWENAKKDYVALGSSHGAEEELASVVEAQGAASLAVDAEKSQNWEECVTQAGVAVMVAAKMLPLRKTRAHCRFERGELLVPSGEDSGLVQEIKDDVKEWREAGTIPAHAPNYLVTRVVEMVCQAYHETKSKKAVAFCDEALALNENSLYGLLSKAQRHMEAENYEAAISALNTAKEHHPEARQINELLHNAQVELKRSKTKDYYKVLGVPKDADELQIKAAYRRMIKQHHPDKAHKLGISKEEAEKKMASVNEAYEVLSDPELKARFDRGDDPNDHEQQRQNPFQGGPFGGHGGGFPFQHGGGSHGGQQFNFKFGGGGFQFGG
ncbi:and TPR domain-containing protein [Rutstroemia sp. NJR-2017a BVV2]|nr:and TPR domain-containing protein [Rutstroemia sp. NJR-2017a BVV2]